MTYDDAKHALLVHGSGTCDPAGKPVVLDDGFLKSLRPYAGLIERNFHQVMEALLVAGERIHRSPQVDRDLLLSLWAMCSYARSWGLDPCGMLQRNKLITTTDAKRLELWVATIESTGQGLLNGNAPHYEVHRYARYIKEVGWWDNIDFFIPLLELAVSDPNMFDAIEMVVQALGKLGGRSRSALPTLHQAADRTYSWYSPKEKCTEEVRGAIRQAIQSIESAGV